jgi:hypothetical protein
LPIFGCALQSSGIFNCLLLQSGNTRSSKHLGSVGSSALLSDEVVSEQLTRFALIGFFP